jgi:heat shock protein 4
MALQDRVMEETKERKNAVEEYVYGMRAKVTEALAPFVDAAGAEVGLRTSYMQFTRSL